MLRMMKDKSKYAGMKCVYWNGNLSTAPERCVIDAITIETSYTAEPYMANRKVEYVYFTVTLKRNNKIIRAEEKELFDNFKECYKQIVKKHANDLTYLYSYGPRDKLFVGLEEATYKAKAEMDYLHRSWEGYSYNGKKASLKDITRMLEETLDKIKKIYIYEDGKQVNYGYLDKTAYRFVVNMSKRFPELCPEMSKKLAELKF